MSLPILKNSMVMTTAAVLRAKMTLARISLLMIGKLLSVRTRIGI